MDLLQAESKERIIEKRPRRSWDRVRVPEWFRNAGATYMALELRYGSLWGRKARKALRSWLRMKLKWTDPTAESGHDKINSSATIRQDLQRTRDAGEALVNQTLEGAEQPRLPHAGDRKGWAKWLHATMTDEALMEQLQFQNWIEGKSEEEILARMRKDLGQGEPWDSSNGLHPDLRVSEESKIKEYYLPKTASDPGNTPKK
jgi:hypothetical protein